MISISEAVIDEWAMMVKKFNTSATCVAVERCLCFHNFIVAAEVFKADLVFQSFINQSNVVVLFLNEARLHEKSQHIGRQHQKHQQSR